MGAFSNIRFDDLKALVTDLSRSGPRYTSYPTAVEFNTEVDESNWSAHLQEECLNLGGATLPLSLYFHLPFCRKLCFFCACNKVVTDDYSVVDPYLDALILELDQYRKILSCPVEIRQIHWGGGTPNFLNPEAMCRLHAATRRVFPVCAHDAEISIEIDPRTTSIEQIETLSDLGFNRISIGVQDFNPEVQNAIHRSQTYEVTRDICLEARRVGFPGINIDLVYGLPEQTVAGFLKTIGQVMELRPDRIALYGYAHVNWLKKSQNAFARYTLPSPEDRVEIFVHALRQITDNGYRYIGMDHFALPEDELSKALGSGRLDRNFMGYTAHKEVDIIGLGVSSISTFRDMFAQNTKSVEAYEQTVSGGKLAIERGLVRNRDDVLRAYVIKSIMCQGEVDFREFENREIGERLHFREYFADALSGMITFLDRELVELRPDVLKLTPLGMLFARNIAMLFDTYLGKHSASGKATFSQSV